MIRRIQSLPLAARLFTFLLIFAGGIVIIVSLTLLLVNSSPREQGYSLKEGVSVQEFATLPDDDAYPAAVAVGADGTVYTGSYASGTVWAIGPDKNARELPDTRRLIGSVTGLAAAPDGTLYVADRVDYDPGKGGALMWQIAPDGTVSQFQTFADMPEQVSPHMVTLDSAGNVYLTDWADDVVWRMTPDGAAAVWWQSPQISGVSTYEPSGLAYDAGRDAILITDLANNIIYRVPVTADDTASATEKLYVHGGRPDEPGLSGITVTASGDIYVAALDVNKVARLDGDALDYIAEGFRGVSDVAAAPDGRIYVTNWNQFSLLVGALQPRLPFALDVIDPGGQ